MHAVTHKPNRNEDQQQTLEKVSPQKKKKKKKKLCMNLNKLVLTNGFPEGNNTLSAVGSNMTLLSAPITTPGKSLKLAP